MSHSRRCWEGDSLMSLSSWWQCLIRQQLIWCVVRTGDPCWNFWEEVDYHLSSKAPVLKPFFPSLTIERLGNMSFLLNLLNLACQFKLSMPIFLGVIVWASLDMSHELQQRHSLQVIVFPIKPCKAPSTWLGDRLSEKERQTMANGSREKPTGEIWSVVPVIIYCHGLRSRIREHVLCQLLALS